MELNLRPLPPQFTASMLQLLTPKEFCIVAGVYGVSQIAERLSEGTEPDEGWINEETRTMHVTVGRAQVPTATGTQRQTQRLWHRSPAVFCLLDGCGRGQRQRE